MPICLPRAARCKWNREFRVRDKQSRPLSSAVFPHQSLASVPWIRAREGGHERSHHVPDDLRPGHWYHIRMRVHQVAYAIFRSFWRWELRRRSRRSGESSWTHGRGVTKQLTMIWEYLSRSLAIHPNNVLRSFQVVANGSRRRPPLQL